MEFHWILSYLALGGLVGFLAGLLGIGGGAVMVPVLTKLFMLQGIPPEHTVHMALATSLAAIIMTSYSSLRAHHRHRGVLWPVVKRIAPGILLGTFSAAYVAGWIPAPILAIFFAAFMGFIALQMMMNRKPQASARKLPGTAGLTVAGVGIGSISALVAIGGGSLTVPFLTWCNVDIRRAIGTSAAVGFPIAVAGSLGYLVSGWGTPGLPDLTLGYVYLPAVVLISAVSFVTAPVGARLTHSLPVARVKKIFALMVILLCAGMLYSVMQA